MRSICWCWFPNLVCYDVHWSTNLPGFCSIFFTGRCLTWSWERWASGSDECYHPFGNLVCFLCALRLELGEVGRMER
jgi:hypothetical protein